MDTSNGLNNAIDYISPFACYENSKTVACVGKNGGTYDEWIREGFSKTVDLVYSQIKTMKTSIFIHCFTVRDTALNLV